MAQISQTDGASVPTEFGMQPKAIENNMEGADLSFQSLIETLPTQLSDGGYSESQLRSLSPVALAYVGDAVFELYVRSRLLIPAKRIRDYHQQVVAQVKAEKQSAYTDQLDPYLTSAEKDILRRGRNATTGRSRRAEAKHYQKATGFEALIGFLYLSDRDRLFSLLAHLNI